MQKVEELLLAHISEIAQLNESMELQLDTSLEDIIDSTAIMELVLWIETTFNFGVELDDIHVDNFGSVSKLTAWIGRVTEPQVV